MFPEDCGDSDTACLRPCRFTGHRRWADDRAGACDTETWGARSGRRFRSRKSHEGNVGFLNGHTSRQSMADRCFIVFHWFSFSFQDALTTCLWIEFNWSIIPELKWFRHTNKCTNFMHNHFFVQCFSLRTLRLWLYLRNYKMMWTWVWILSRLSCYIVLNALCAHFFQMEKIMVSWY